MSLLFNLYTRSGHWRVCSSQDRFLHQVLELVAQSCPTLCDPMDCSPPGSSVHGDSPGKNTGVGCHALLQGTFLTQGSPSSPKHLLHCSLILCVWLPGKPLLHQTEMFNTLHGSAVNCYGTWRFAPGHFWIFIEESFIGLLIGEFDCIWWGRGKWKSLSCIWLLATPWTIQSMEFSRTECWSG